VTITPDYVLSAKVSASYRLYLNSSSFNNSASSGDSLVVAISKSEDFSYSDASSKSFGLDPSDVPFTVFAGTYE